MNAKLLIDAHAELGEGALWDVADSVLWWVDIDGCRLHRHNPASGVNDAWDIGQREGTLVRRASGAVVLAVESGFLSFDPDTGAMAQLNDPEAHLPGNRFNDGKCDPAGRFWAGTMSLHGESGTGTLWRLDADLKASPMITGVSTSNGLVWSADKRTFYYIDTPTRQVAAYDFDNTTGDISNRRIVIEVPPQEGFPDGMAIDSQDRLWIAHWGGWARGVLGPAIGPGP